MRNPVHRSSTTEVLIIGAGMAGGAIAKRLSDRGIEVVCLEQGPELNPLELPHMSDTFELDKTRGHNVHPNVRGLREDYPVTSDNEGSSIRMVSAVGGSANKYSGVWMRPKPADFRKGMEHGMAPDWPISYEDLAPYFDVCDDEMGVSGVEGDPAYPRRHRQRLMPAIPMGRAGMALGGAMNRLGWHWWPTDNAIVTEPFDGRMPCSHCGQCVMGCPQGSMSTSATSFWPQALRNGVDLRTGARVHRLVRDGDRITGGEYEDLATGAMHRVTADIVVVCANGIGTPRLLLMSDVHGGMGLANSSGLVGKNLMFHPMAFVEGIFDDPMDSYKGARGSPLYCGEFYDTDPARGFVNGYTMIMVRAPGAGYAAMGYSTFKPVDWGPNHHRHFGEMFNRQAWLLNLGEDIPLERNTVTLDPDEKDSSGLPAPKAYYRMHDQDRRLARHSIARGEEVMKEAGARIVNNSGVLEQPCGFHLMGTARMGSDPRRSVINKWHRSWDLRNLFICDGSSMVTSFGVTPTATIGAMAVRLADYLARHKGQVLQTTATEEAALAG